MNNQTSTYRLSELMGLVQGVLLSSFDRSYWVTAEIANISQTKGKGHLYFELVEKQKEALLAKARAVLWAGMQGRQILDHFQSVSRQQLKVGMKILVQLKVGFHPVFGLSFQVLDIDATYSLGEMERQKQATIALLQEEGLLDFNKQFVLPSVLQRIAVISSEQAAGYQDFKHQLEQNEYSYAFEVVLFPALMQGEHAPQSIIQALEKVENIRLQFDAICILRGGGSNIDLACFNDYTLCAALAQATLPVLSGIGHERDTSIVDMVVHTRLKTPTAVAEFILSHNLDFERKLNQAFNSICEWSIQMLSENQSILERCAYHVHYHSKDKLQMAKDKLQLAFYKSKEVGNHNIRKAKRQLSITIVKLQLSSSNQIKTSERQHIIQHKERLQVAGHKEFHRLQNILVVATNTLTGLNKHIEQKHKHLSWIQQIVQISDPQQWLQKGFALIRQQGRIISQSEDIEVSQNIEIELKDSILETKINNIKKKAE